MINERPPVLPLGRVREWILQCIQIVDERAVDLAENLPAKVRGPLRKVIRREFVKMAKTLNQLQMNASR